MSAARGPDAFVLEVGRLTLRRVTRADTPMIQRLNGDPAVMRYITGPAPADETDRWVQTLIAGYAQRPRLGWFVVEERDGGAPIGLAALKHISETNAHALAALIAGCEPDELIEIGWRFLPAAWGRGYATVTGRALVRLGFVELGLSRIIAMAMIANVASCRAIQKCGLSPVGEYEVLGRSARMFAITREQYQAAN